MLLPAGSPPREGAELGAGPWALNYCAHVAAPPLQFAAAVERQTPLLPGTPRARHRSPRPHRNLRYASEHGRAARSHDRPEPLTTSPCLAAHEGPGRASIRPGRSWHLVGSAMRGPPDPRICRPLRGRRFPGSAPRATPGRHSRDDQAQLRGQRDRRKSRLKWPTAHRSPSSGQHGRSVVWQFVVNARRTGTGLHPPRLARERSP
jgi:hypothetical protein